MFAKWKSYLGTVTKV